jgi:LTXXQ motif family protein
MRRCTILGVVALSFAVAAAAEARPRFGPGTILRALPAPFGAMLGGFRGSGSRHVRRARTERPSPPRAAAVTRPEQAAAQVAVVATVGWAGVAFWPQAFDDLSESLLDGSGKRFWSHGYGDILDGMFAASDAKPPDVAATQPCGAPAPDSANRWIERIEQALQPTTEQRPALEELRAALTTASERIATACRGTLPATPPQRLEAMQDRLWAMRDGALTLRVPLEKLYAQLTDEQKARLAGGDADRRGTPADAGATEGRAGAGGSARICGEQAAAIAEWPTQAIERTVRPVDQQRGGLEALRMLSMGMGQLIMTSCPNEPPADPLGRLAAATERITVMLFAVKTTSSALQGVYDSLTDDQKTAFNKVARQQQRRSGRLPGGS